MFVIGVLSITGGYDGSDDLSSTEVLTKERNTWETIGSLPRAMYAMKAVSIDNTIIVTGNITFVTVILLHVVTHYRV